MRLSKTHFKLKKQKEKQKNRMNYAHCKGIGCPLKNSCERNKYFRNSIASFEKYDGNASFIPPMFILNKEENKISCDFFIGEEGSSLLKKFKQSLLDIEK